MTPLNQRGACGEDFTSLTLFDRHRVGKHELDYPEHEDGWRCLTLEQMQERGRQRDRKGRRQDPVQVERAPDAFYAVGGSTERPSGPQRHDLTSPARDEAAA